jgi:undecaprenyl-diphosphatase
MTLLQVIVLGIVHGVTQFVPISAGAHLRIVPALFGWHFYGGTTRDPGPAFTGFLQLATMAALIVYFWRELLHITVGWVRGLYDKTVRSSLEYKLGWYLIVATVPFAVLVILLGNRIDRGSHNLWLLAYALVGVGVLLHVAERAARRERDEEQILRGDAITVGVAQLASLVPGVSRPGIMITAGLFRGLTRETAARFAFLLSIPSVIVSAAYEAARIGEHHSTGPGVGLTGLAVIIAFLVGLASLSWLMRWLTRHSTVLFSYYGVALGVFVIILLGTGTLHAGD